MSSPPTSLRPPRRTSLSAACSSSFGAYAGPSLQGEYRVVTLFTRTGQVTTNDNVPFDNPANPANGSTYNPGYPFLPVIQGGR